MGRRKPNTETDYSEDGFSHSIFPSFPFLTSSVALSVSLLLDVDVEEEEGRELYSVGLPMERPRLEWPSMLSLVTQALKFRNHIPLI